MEDRNDQEDPRGIMASNKNSGKQSSHGKRHNFAAMNKVKEARAKSPLPEEEQVRLVREFTAWDDVPPADVDNLVSALMGESYTLGNTVYLQPEELQSIQDMMSKPVDEATRVQWAEDNGSAKPTSPVYTVEPSDEDIKEPGNAEKEANTGVKEDVQADATPKDHTDGSTATGRNEDAKDHVDEDAQAASTIDGVNNDDATDGDMQETSGDGTDGAPLEAADNGSKADGEDPEDVDAILAEDEVSLADALGSTFKSVGGFLGGLKHKVHDSWVDWTADVRVPVEDGTDVQDGMEEDHTASPAAPAKPKTVRVSVSLDKDGTEDPVVPVDGEDAVGDVDVEVEEKEFRLPNPLNGIKAIKSVAGSFIDGVAGRPIRPRFVVSPTAKEEAKTPEWKTAMKWIVRVLAVIGGLALVRAALDAFRPRR